MSPTLAARRARRALYISIAIGLSTLVVGLVLAIASIRQTQLDGTPTGRKLLAASERILDCTDAGDDSTGRPPGKCFTESQERTRDAVGNINEVAVLAAACAAGLPDGLSDDKRVIRTQRCLIEQLAAKP